LLYTLIFFSYCMLYSFVLIIESVLFFFIFFFQAEDGIRDRNVTGVQTCALPIFNIMNGLRSVTTGTNDLSKTKELFSSILGLNVADKGQALRCGDAELNSSTRIHVVEVPNYINNNNHIENIGLRVPSDEGLEEYQSILEQHQITFGAPTDLNGHKHFNFQDQNGQTFNIYSNEHNSGTPLGIPTFESNVNPLHQIQGLGPVILKVNDIVLTQSILTRVFGLEHFAEYTPNDHANFKIQVFRIGD